MGRVWNCATAVKGPAVSVICTAFESSPPLFRSTVFSFLYVNFQKGGV